MRSSRLYLSSWLSRPQFELFEVGLEGGAGRSDHIADDGDEVFSQSLVRVRLLPAASPLRAAGARRRGQWWGPPAGLVGRWQSGV